MKDKYKIVFEQTANFARAEGLSVTEAGLAGKGKPDVIVCANDDMALGAMEAAKARGFNDIKIYGFDALPEALKAVKDGGMQATIEQFPGEQSREAMRVAVAFARDGKKPAEAGQAAHPDRDHQGQPRQGRARRRNEVSDHAGLTGGAWGRTRCASASCRSLPAAPIPPRSPHDRRA